VDFKYWDISTRSVFSRDNEIFYGEGPDTSPLNPIKVYGDRLEFDTAILRRISKGVRLGMEFTLRSRHQRDAEVELEGLPDIQVNRNVIPDETEAGVGMRAEWDSRNSFLYPTRGRLLVFEALMFPPEWSNRLRAKEDYSTQFQLDYRKYQKIHQRIVWANRGWLATSVGNLGYQYRYNLGGNRELRGYGSNRFRGDHVYLYQTELRVKVWGKYLFAVVSADIGSVFDGGKTQLQASQQVGLRIALPPSWGWKLKLEQGWGKDQQNFVIHVGETF
jgi:outer membrane protein assembly factor BamA